MANNSSDLLEVEQILLKVSDNEGKIINNDAEVHADNQCGFFIFKGSTLQKFASKKAFVIVYGFIALGMGSAYSYLNGVLTTLEKRFKIPSQTTGMITVGYDCASIFMLPILSHYLAKKHRPRWISFASFMMALYLFLFACLHLIYGPGDDALSLTREHMPSFNKNSNNSNMMYDTKKNNTLCLENSMRAAECNIKSQQRSELPKIYVFGLQLFCGAFTPIYDTLGITYMDDNIQNSKTAAYISISFFLKMLGPTLGYSVASFSLQKYIAPSLTPTIDNSDSRWIGGYWIGDLILSAFMFCIAIVIGMFPKELPRKSLRRLVFKTTEKVKSFDENDEKTISNGIIMTFKRILSNRIFLLINIGLVFHYFGLVPFWIFTPKYLETQYRQSASASNFLTGTFAIFFSVLGITVAGTVITKYKPSARMLVGWVILARVISATTCFTFIFLGCSSNDKSVITSYSPISFNSSQTCISNCDCDYIKYSPVCGSDGNTYISPCHAGCKEQYTFGNGSTIYTTCRCILNNYKNDNYTGYAESGACSVNCENELIIFMALICLNKFLEASVRASSFLLSVRCVQKTDKAVSLAISLTMSSLFAFLPGPILFGWLIDQTCTVWGKTCEGTGNCWLYDGEALRYWMNMAAGSALAIGALVECGVWYNVKNLVVFDNEEK